MSKTILVTGGAGYIGSHTCVALAEAGWSPVILDNFCNSNPVIIPRLKRLTGQELPFIEGDVLDADLCAHVLEKYDCQGVIHFAGLKAVGESNDRPLDYYNTNVMGSLSLLQAMAKRQVCPIIFSSSATVYGVPQYLPLDEKHPTGAANPYGQTKLLVEHMLRDVVASDNGLKCAILRYFNPVGAHSSGEIGEDPNGPPNNLMPYIAQVAVGRREQLSVFGNDYDTPDGTGVRDYIHVVDLAEAHVLAMQRLVNQGESFTVNLGTGVGYSVLEMVRAFEKASDQKVPHMMAERRLGDVAMCYADPTLATDLLGWRAKKDLSDMCKDHWRWQASNPHGYTED